MRTRRRTKTRFIGLWQAAAFSYSQQRRIPRPWRLAGLPPMNQLSIKPFDFQAALARAGLRPDGTPMSSGVDGSGSLGGGTSPTSSTSPTSGPGSFGQAMASALESVSQSQMQAGQLQRELTLGNPQVSVEQTMLSMQKAELGFQAVVQVRNRLAQAYTDIMNMQV
jgi:flagellar hook-basal body complex protein FliE